MPTTIDDLTRLMEYMRGKNGCPWDRAQDMDDFLVHLKNESDEVLAAIKKKDYENLREELGDLLWNIIFISQLAKEKKKFDFAGVMDDIRKKIIRRHPHVFGNAKASTPEEVIKHYQRIKRQEKLMLPHNRPQVKQDNKRKK
ncbi:MAG: MazG nucleotide pyrophosphohydrolase domain-containing protein [Candidatus Altiarchaeota archaeon]|nr:MazG nucleotide pyrophosphohydrolase domain-containing protein [Candidatus Altiarchaeota archaeon]